MTTPNTPAAPAEPNEKALREALKMCGISNADRDAIFEVYRALAASPLNSGRHQHAD